MSQPDRPASAAEGLVNHQKYNDHVPTASPEAVAVLHRSSTGVDVRFAFIVGAPYRVALVAVKRLIPLWTTHVRTVGQRIPQMCLDDHPKHSRVLNTGPFCATLYAVEVSVRQSEDHLRHVVDRSQREVEHLLTLNVGTVGGVEELRKFFDLFLMRLPLLPLWNCYCLLHRRYHLLSLAVMSRAAIGNATLLFM